MAYSYKGAISFGLIYIPVTLNLAIKNNDIKFNLLDKKTKSRVEYKKTCVDCNNREISQTDIVKGYQYEKDKYVILDEEDFEKIKSKKDKNITIQQFIDMKEIDPVYFDKSYYVVPTGAEKAYKLLVDAMKSEGKAGIAKSVLGMKETLIALRVKDGQLLLNTLFFHEEVQKNPAVDIKVDTNEKELSLAKMLIGSMTEKFDISSYKDEYREKIQEAIEAKITGKEIVAPKDTPIHKITNIMEALQQSLKIQEKKPAEKKKKAQ